MPIALDTAGLPSQPHQGVGARLVRRLGGAVRSAIVSAITLTGARRRPVLPQTSQDHAAAQHPQAPVPRRVPVPHPPRAALPAPLLLPPWLPPLLARRRRRPACLNQADTPFTPETHPQLSPKACAVLNTPVKDCDPKTLELLVSTFTQYINQVMSPETGSMDPQAVLPNLWHRLSTTLADTDLDVSLPAAPQPVPATLADEVPDAPVASPHPPAPLTGPTMPSAKDASRLSPLPLPGLPASDPLAEAITTTAAAPKTPPDFAARSAPVRHASLRRRLFRRRRASFLGSRSDKLQCLPPPWRLYYAACTGPP